MKNIDDARIFMLKFKLICPQCGASVITSTPEAMVWERCPYCGHHVWDQYDVMMADACPSSNHDISGRRAHADN